MDIHSRLHPTWVFSRSILFSIAWSWSQLDLYIGSCFTWLFGCLILIFDRLIRRALSHDQPIQIDKWITLYIGWLDLFVWLNESSSRLKPCFGGSNLLTQVNYGWVCLSWISTLVSSIIHLIQLTLRKFPPNFSSLGCISSFGSLFLCPSRFTGVIFCQTLCTSDALISSTLFPCYHSRSFASSVVSIAVSPILLVLSGPSGVPYYLHHISLDLESSSTCVFS